MTYICDNCGGSFAEPLQNHYDSPEYGPVTDIYCPHCGEELGKNKISRKYHKKLARIYGVTVDELLAAGK